MQKSKKKEEKKNLYGTFSFAFFFISGDKRAEKISCFVFFRNWRGKM